MNALAPCQAVPPLIEYSKFPAPGEVAVIVILPLLVWPQSVGLTAATETIAGPCGALITTGFPAKAVGQALF